MNNTHHAHAVVDSGSVTRGTSVDSIEEKTNTADDGRTDIMDNGKKDESTLTFSSNPNISSNPHIRLMADSIIRKVCGPLIGSKKPIEN